MQITVNGQRVTVSEDFTRLSPEQQDATVDEIASSMQSEQGVWERGMLAPLERNTATGERRLAVPQAALNVWDAIQLPGQALRGEVEDLDPRVGAENMSAETFSRILNAGSVMTPATPASAFRMSTGTSPGVQRRFQAAAEQSGVPLGEVNTRLQQMGPGAMVMDLGVPLQQQASGIARSVGPGQQQLWNSVEGRARAAGGRLMDDVQGALGTGAPAATIADDIVRQQSAAADPLYQAVRNVQLPVSTEIQQIMQTPMGQRAFREAAEMAANDQMPVNGLTVGLLDYAKRALDDIYASANRSGNGNLARQARNMSRALAAQADALVPQYAQARNTFAGYAAVNEALDQGVNLFRRDTHPMEFAQTYQTMTQSERDALLQGARSAIEDAMGNAVNDAGAIRNLLNRPYNRQKLEVLLGAEQAAALVQAIEREMAFGQTRQLVTQGSVTAFGQAGQRAANPEQFQQQPQSIVQLLSTVFSNARNRFASQSRQEENQQFANLLTQGQVPQNMLEPNRWRFIDQNAPGAITNAERFTLSELARQGGGGGW